MKAVLAERNRDANVVATKLDGLSEMQIAHLSTLMESHRTMREILWSTHAEVHGAHEASMLQSRWDQMQKSSWFATANADLAESAQAQRTAERELTTRGLSTVGPPDMWAIYSEAKRAEGEAVRNTACIRCGGSAGRSWRSRAARSEGGRVRPGHTSTLPIACRWRW